MRVKFKGKAEVLEYLKTLGDEPASSSKLGTVFAYEALATGLLEKDVGQVERALLELENRSLRGIDQRFQLLGTLIKADWPEGFDLVERHFNLRSERLKDENGRLESYELKDFMERGAFNLVVHHWWGASKEERAGCIESFLSLEMALILVRSGDMDTLRQAMKDPEKDAEWGEVLGKGLTLLQRDAGDAQTYGTIQENVADVREVVKILIDEGPSQFKKRLWSFIGQVDNVRLLKKLISTGVISEASLEVRETPESFYGRSTSGVGFSSPLSCWVLPSESNQLGKWSAKGKTERTFNFAELVCTYSRERMQILSHCVQNNEFREALMVSEVARDAFVNATSTNTWGVLLYEELKSFGVNVGVLTTQAGKSPLHRAAESFKGRPRDRELVSELLSVHAEWMEHKDGEGRTPLECVKAAYADELTAIFEMVQIKNLIKKEKKSTAKDAPSGAKNYRM